MKPPRASSGTAERRSNPGSCKDHWSTMSRARSAPTKGIAKPARSGIKATTRRVLGALELFATERRSTPTATRTRASAYQAAGATKRRPIQTKNDGTRIPIAPTLRMNRPITKATFFTMSLSRCLTACGSAASADCHRAMCSRNGGSAAAQQRASAAAAG